MWEREGPWALGVDLDQRECWFTGQSHGSPKHWPQSPLVQPTGWPLPRHISEVTGG